MLQHSLSSHHDPYRVAAVPAAKRADPACEHDVAVLTVQAINGCSADVLTLDLTETDYVRIGGDLYVDRVRIGCVAGGDGTALRLTLTAERREAVNAAWLPMLACQIATALADLAVNGTSVVDTSGRLRPLAANASPLSPIQADPDALLTAIDLVRSATPIAYKGAEAAPRLSPRQREVLRLVADGRSNKRIAIDLGVSPATVKTHVASVIATIGAQNRTDAAIKARERGWI